MTHVEPERLALMAMDEQQPTADERAHLLSCSLCAEELADLSRTVGAARGAGDVAWETPSPVVWERIRSELGLGAEAVPS